MQFGLMRVGDSQVFNTIDGELTPDSIQLWVHTETNDTILLSLPNDQARGIALTIAAHLDLEIYAPAGTE